MVIGRTPLTTELYGGRIVDEYAKSYAVNIRNRFKASASHIVVTNYRKSHMEAMSTRNEVAAPMLFEPAGKYGND